MLVRLTLKLANLMDGVDVSSIRVGDLIELSDADAELLIAEGWAMQVGGNGDGARSHATGGNTKADVEL